MKNLTTLDMIPLILSGNVIKIFLLVTLSRQGEFLNRKQTVYLKSTLQFNPNISSTYTYKLWAIVIGFEPESRLYFFRSTTCVDNDGNVSGPDGTDLCQAPNTGAAEPDPAFDVVTDFTMKEIIRHHVEYGCKRMDKIEFTAPKEVLIRCQEGCEPQYRYTRPSKCNLCEETGMTKEPQCNYYFDAADNAAKEKFSTHDSTDKSLVFYIDPSSASNCVKRDKDLRAHQFSIMLNLIKDYWNFNTNINMGDMHWIMHGYC